MVEEFKITNNAAYGVASGLGGMAGNMLVNADRMTLKQAAVSLSMGSATTAIACKLPGAGVLISSAMIVGTTVRVLSSEQLSGLEKAADIGRMAAQTTASVAAGVVGA